MCWSFLFALCQIEGSAEIVAGQSNFQSDARDVPFLSEFTRGRALLIGHG